MRENVFMIKKKLIIGFSVVNDDVICCVWEFINFVVIYKGWIIFLCLILFYVIFRFLYIDK